MPRSLRTQLALSAAVLVLVVVAAAGLVIAMRGNAQDLAQVDQDLKSRAAGVSADAGRVVADHNQDESAVHPAGDDMSRDEAGLLAGSQSLVRVISAGKVVSQHGEVPPGAIPLPTASGYSTISIDGQPWRSWVGPVQGGEIQVLDSLGPVEQRLHDNARLVAAVAGPAALVTALGVWLVTGLLLAPLQRLRAGAAQIRSGHDLAQRLPAVGAPHEVVELSDTLNGMLGGLQSSMASTRRFTADAGHELRTPLTSIGVDLETLSRNPDLPVEQRRQMLEAMSAEHARIVGLLDGLQRLARGDAGALPSRGDVEVADLVGQCVERARRHHPGTVFEMRDGAPDGLVVAGWPDGLRIAVDNLLDNAARHGRPGGRVVVGVTPGDPGRDAAERGGPGLVEITVSDDGPGIPVELRAQMLQRFARGPGAHSEGSGLGLALVEQQALLHDGTLALGDADGGGLEATLRLPTSDG